MKQEMMADELRSILDYDSHTGILRWRERPIISNYDRCWNGRWAGSVVGCEKEGYVRIEIFNTAYYAHRLAWLLFYGEWPPSQIDHINGDRSDNRIINLRLATHHENCWNAQRPVTNTSGIKGVSYNRRRQKWHGKVWVKGKQNHIGFFDTKEEAAAAVQAFREQFHGEYANHGGAK